MAKTLLQIQKQIDALQRKADELKQKEAGEVIARIQDAIQHYGLTAADLGFTKAKGKRAAVPVRKRAARKAAPAAKYRDESGRTWTGRGRRPKWFVDGLAAGKKPEDFAV